MSNKFTEEQYQKIVEKWDGEISYIEATKAVVGYLAVEDLGYSISNQALALANPLTRELAHDKFVEKEKKYVWRLKTDNNLVISKMFDGWFVDTAPNANNHFSEKEINNSPFKPEWFDKEEVD